MNRGVEIGSEVPEMACTTISEQVANGVSVRMAVLFWLLGAQPEVASTPDVEAAPATEQASAAEVAGG